MVPIVFDPGRVGQFLKALETGEPLTPPEAGWSVAEMLMAAGTMHYALMAHGPTLNGKPAGMAGVPKEHQEAFAAVYAGELAAAIETCSRLACDLHVGKMQPTGKLLGHVMTVDGQAISHIAPRSTQRAA
jgi:hypothetical protein